MSNLLYNLVMDKLLIKILKTIRNFNLISANDRVLLGLSGGFDSTCLLHLLASARKILNFELFAAHVNHNLRKNANRDYEYTKEITEKLGVKLFYNSIDLTKFAKDKKISLETAGRSARYSFLAEVASQENISKIATAHNSNDNAESVIMHMIRGSGMEGLCGILPIRDFFEEFRPENDNNIQLIRPLIEISRAEVEKYCSDYKLSPRMDESNLSNDYFRNKIRNNIIPTIIENNGLDPINRLSETIRSENNFLNDLVEVEFKSIVYIESNKILIRREKLCHLHKAILRRLIQKCTQVLGIKNVSSTQIEEILKICYKNYGNKLIKLPGSWIAQLKDKKLAIFKN